MSNLKAGDMALYIGDKMENLCAGSIVTLEVHIPSGETVHLPDAIPPQSFFMLRECWGVRDDNGRGYVVHHEKLMPLRGDFSLERQKSQEMTA